MKWQPVLDDEHFTTRNGYALLYLRFGELSYICLRRGALSDQTFKVLTVWLVTRGFKHPVSKS